MTRPWTGYLPGFLKKRIEESQILQRIIHNTGWLFIDKLLRMGVGFFVTVWITRYLGPEKYGLLSYAAAFVGLFTAIANLGLYGIVLRDVVRCPESTDEILGTAFILKFTGGIIALILSVGIICFLRPKDMLTLWLVAISATGLIFQSFEVFDFWFQSRLLSKRTVFANIPGFLLITIAKIIMILVHAPLTAFAWAGALEILFGGVGLLTAYQLVTKRACFLRFSTTWARRLFKDCWPLILSGLMMMVYNRIDQVMLGQMLGNHSVGIYSVAVKLAELWYIFPLMALNSMFPAILEAKKSGDAEFYLIRVQKVMNLMAVIAYLFIVPLSLFSKTIINLLYGSAYAESGPILAVYVLAGIFYLLGYTREYWVTTENLTRFCMYSTGLGAILNVILNIYLIPAYGAIGAAYATLISIIFGGYLINALFRETRPIFFIQSNSLFLLFAFAKGGKSLKIQ